MERTATLFPIDDEPTKTHQRPKDGAKARDKALAHLRAWRPHLIVKFQHAALDYLLKYGTVYVPDLSDDFCTPPKIRRVFIGAAVRILAEEKMIIATGERRATTLGGRHGNIYEVWQLAAGIDACA